MCGSSSVCFFLSEEARALRGFGAIGSLSLRSFPSLARTDEPLNLTWPHFFWLVNVQCVSSQLFKHGQKTWSRVQGTVTPPSPTNSNVAPRDPLPFPFFFVKKLLYVIIYNSLFTIQSVKMSNKNKYQCYSSWSIQYNRSLPFLIEMLSEMEFHLGIFPEI